MKTVEMKPEGSGKPNVGVLSVLSEYMRGHCTPAI